MHTLFVREHNRLAGELAIAHPDWTDDQYRFYQSEGDFHFYTPSVGERDSILDNLPQYELEGNGGVAYHVPIYE